MNPATLRALLEGDLENALVASTPGGIERQEKQGQSKMVNSSVLPKDINWGQREKFEQMGIVFGEPADDLFVNVTLPEGWKVEPTDHSMWSNLLDNKGRKRGMIFYKAAFYDRSAHLDIVRRFSYHTMPVGGYGAEKNRETHPQECVVEDCGEVIWRSDPMTPSVAIPVYRVSDVLSPLGKKWLEQNYPDWENPLAYWD